MKHKIDWPQHVDSARVARAKRTKRILTQWAERIKLFKESK